MVAAVKSWRPGKAKRSSSRVTGHRPLAPRRQKLVMAAFDRGQKPTIACVNLSTKLSDTDFRNMVAAMQVALDTIFGPVWGVSATLVIATGDVPAGNWGLVFWDNADVAGALGYHDLTADGMPLSHIFVETTLSDGGLVSVTASHELWEMLVDPGIQLWAINPATGVLWAYETADAVEESSFPVKVADGSSVQISNFVYPSWFEGFRGANSTQFDYMNQCTKPFQLLKGGYSIVMSGTREQQVFGSAAKKKRFAKEDRRLHRSQFRNEALKTRTSRKRRRKPKSMRLALSM